MVRLVDRSQVFGLQQHTQISIPTWCDQQGLTGPAGATGATFQFQHGAISSSTKQVALLLIHLNFNSNMVRLVVDILILLGQTQVHFNSNMVRLVEKGIDIQHGNKSISIPTWCDQQQMLRIAAVHQLIKFQFQHGAISSYKTGSYLFDLYISIPTWCDQQLKEKNKSLTERDFNSNMVRLVV